MKNLVLIIDDEINIRETLAGVLEDEGFEVKTAETGEKGLSIAQTQNFACILLDVWLPGIDGIGVLQKLREQNVDYPIIMISGHSTIETAVRATKLGAFDFLEKPLSSDKTILAIRNAITQRELERTNAQLKEKLGEEYVMIGDSVAMRALRKQIAVVAPTDGRVVISGESGTGKELVARAIYAQSRRSAAPFIEVNSAAIPEELVESELFGHVKGAFTGATTAKKGKFEMADRATLFLDEIGDMSPRVQAKMLRVLEEQRFEPLGGNNAIKVDVRVLAATNKDLNELIETGAFRSDLLYRLNVVPFEVPPLRERVEDIPLLLDYFNRKFSTAYNKPLKIFSSDAIERLQNYSFPGNVRELRNTVERVIIMNSEQSITADDLPALASEAEISAASFRFPSFKDATDAYQREFILHKIEEAEGNVSRAAEIMGVDRSHLYRRMKSLGIYADRTKVE